MNKDNSVFDWNSYFSSQASWTRNLREFISTQLGIKSTSFVLEIGCGTGVILRELSEFSGCKPIGIDLDFNRLKIAKNLSPNQFLICADANNLPFPTETFDYVVSHYLLLWIKEPSQVLQEVFRVLLQKGFGIAFAEPDYKGRIEYPSEFDVIRKLQSKSLRRQGANPDIGRRLPELFSKAGFKAIQYGVSGFQKSAKSTLDDYSSEWAVLKEDLKFINSEDQFETLRLLDETFSKKGGRVSWVPTFYAFGRKD